MATALAFKKTAANIVPPSNAADLTSGMQLATCNGAIGVLSETPAENAPGQSIGLASAADYHESIAAA